MTHPPDPQIADSVGNWIAAGVYAVFLLWRRSKQNDKLGAKVEAATKAEVAAIQDELGKLQGLRESDATRSAIMTDRMNQLEGHVMELIDRISKFETALPQATEVLEKVLNTLERLRSGTLVEKTEVTGSVAFKEEKRPK